jgi:hypothetical protein
MSQKDVFLHFSTKQTLIIACWQCWIVRDRKFKVETVLMLQCIYKHESINYIPANLGLISKTDIENIS